jgi:uncharacterized delta-60 repeat protein
VRPSPFVLALCVLASSLTSPAVAGSPEDLDPSFGGDGLVGAFAAGGVATGVAVDARGRILVGGYTIDGEVDLAVARFLPNGTPDASFGGGDGRVRLDLGGAEFAFDLVVDAADRPILVGSASDGASSTILAVRLAEDGTPDASFGTGGAGAFDLGKRFGSAGGAALTPGGKLMLGGYVGGATTNDMVVLRLTDDGGLDGAFGSRGRVVLNLSDGAEQITDLLVASTGRIYAAGQAEVATVPWFAAVKLLADGRRDRSFSRDGVALVSVAPGADVANAITRQANGKVVLAGRTADGGANDLAVVRFGTDGSLDPTFHGDGIRIVAFPGPVDEAFDVRAADGGLWIAGRTRAGTDDLTLIRLHGGGANDDRFSTDGVARIDVAGGADAARALALQPDGDVVIAGEAERDGTVRFAVARFAAAA